MGNFYLFFSATLTISPFPSPGDLPDPGIEPRSPALAGGFFTAKPPGKLMAKSRDRYIQVPKKKIMEIHSLWPVSIRGRCWYVYSESTLFHLQHPLIYNLSTSHHNTLWIRNYHLHLTKQDTSWEMGSSVDERLILESHFSQNHVP